MLPLQGPALPRVHFQKPCWAPAVVDSKPSASYLAGKTAHWETLIVTQYSTLKLHLCVMLRGQHKWHHKRAVQNDRTIMHYGTSACSIPPPSCVRNRTRHPRAISLTLQPLTYDCPLSDPALVVKMLSVFKAERGRRHSQYVPCSLSSLNYYDSVPVTYALLPVFNPGFFHTSHKQTNGVCKTCATSTPL